MAAGKRKRTARRRDENRRDDHPYHHGELREVLIEAAELILEREGLGGLTLRKAARNAGVSHAAPAHHFGDLGGLLAAVAAEGYRSLHRAMLKAYHEVPDTEPVTRLRATGLAYVASAVGSPGRFRVMFHPALADKSNYADLRRASRETLGVLVKAIEECQRTGAVKAGDPRELALTAWSAVHGFAVLAVDGQLKGKGFTRDQSELAVAVTTHLFVGLRSA